MPKITITSLSGKKCAFCKNWNDPTNSHIKHAFLDTWEYDNKAKEYCPYKRGNSFAFGTCKNFELKIPTRR